MPPPDAEAEHPDLEFHPVTPQRWGDLVSLFEQHGNPGYCWCMRWRLKSAEFRRLDSAGRKAKMHTLIHEGVPVGVLGYLGGEPTGWCSIAPRQTYTLLEKSRTLTRIDDLPTWSVVCFFIQRKARRQGFSVKLLQAAVAYAVSQGATIIEGYPVEPGRSYQFMGSPSVFEQAGFHEVAIARNGRRMVRLLVEKNQPGSIRNPFPCRNLVP
jgi:GNAT superfamily N-acetyltransferase